MTAPNFGLARTFRALSRNLLFDGSSGALVGLSEGAFCVWQEYLAWQASICPGSPRTDHAAGPGGARPAPASPPGLTELVAAGLFRRPEYPGATSPLAAKGLHSLCLNVAHACDLACDYCFAGRGSYGSPVSGIMQPDMARAAIDYILANSPPGRTLSVDFFGGEPLLAWPAVVEAVRYGRERAAAAGKTILFTLTTNGVGLDDERASFCAANMSTLIVSLDGRPEVHDRHRRTRSGGPSSGQALAGARRLADAIARRESAGAGPGRAAGGSAFGGGVHAAFRPDLPVGSGPLWIRGTFTRDNLDFWRDVEYLAKQGFRQVSMEPVAQPPDPGLALRDADFGAIRESYERVADLVLAGRVRFFHFELNTESPACAPKRFTGCSAGGGYACVNPAGEVYPCHQFDGVRDHLLDRLEAADGSGEGAPVYRSSPRLSAAHVGNKPACRDCWAQLHCGGGCHYAAYKWGGDVLSPYPFGCELMKARLETALAVQAALAGRQPPRGIQGSPGASSGRR